MNLRDDDSPFVLRDGSCGRVINGLDSYSFFALREAWTAIDYTLQGMPALVEARLSVADDHPLWHHGIATTSLFLTIPYAGTHYSLFVHPTHVGWDRPFFGYTDEQISSAGLWHMLPSLVDSLFASLKDSPYCVPTSDLLAQGNGMFSCFPSALEHLFVAAALGGQNDARAYLHRLTQRGYSQFGVFFCDDRSELPIARPLFLHSDGLGLNAEGHFNSGCYVFAKEEH